MSPFGMNTKKLSPVLPTDIKNRNKTVKPLYDINQINIFEKKLPKEIESKQMKGYTMKSIYTMSIKEIADNDISKSKLSKHEKKRKSY